jgi:aminopeptidase
VQSSARSGAAVLERMIGTDDGARRLGEVALVPHSNPISQSGVLFFNTLFDENAASHIALGQAYSKCFVRDELSAAELDAARREPQPDPCGLDDRFRRDGCGRRP